MAEGLPELDIPSMEPLRINQLAMENNAGNIRIKALFSDILAYGASNWTVKEVRSDIKVIFSHILMSQKILTFFITLPSETSN